MSTFSYTAEEKISAEAFVQLLRWSGLSKRRPVEDMDCIQGMIDHADLIVTAWRGDDLVGVARSVTDFNYCCYVSDLAVDLDFQHLGVGRELLRETKRSVGEGCSLILLSAPDAAEYYPRVGFTQHQGAFRLGSEQEIL